MARKTGKKGKSIHEHIRTKFHSVKQRIKEGIRPPYILIFAVAIAIIGLFVLGIKVPFANENMSAVINNRVVSYVSLYYGYVNITINNATLDNNVWKINLNGYASDGIVNLDVEMNAMDFSIQKVTQTLPMPSKPNTINFLDKTTGCSVGDSKTVDIYIDPYDPWSIKYDGVMNNFTEKFAGMYVNYRILSTYSYKYISTDSDSDAYVALKYYECAKDKSYFRQFRGCVMERYAEKKEFLTEEELLSCVQQSGGSRTEIQECSAGNAVLSNLATDQRFAETFLGAATTPMIVIDCRYSTYPLFAEYAFCYLYPDKRECKE